LVSIGGSELLAERRYRRSSSAGVMSHEDHVTTSVGSSHHDNHDDVDDDEDEDAYDGDYSVDAGS